MKEVLYGSRGVFTTQSNVCDEVFFAKITCLRESSIVDVRLDSKYASGKCTRSLLHVKRKIGLPICYVPFTCEKKNRTTNLLCDISFNCFFSNQVDTHCAWKLPRYGVISGPHFPVFGLNTRKYAPKITPYLDTFYAVV